jgi:phosphatidylglycerophosphate synthase
MPEIGEPSDIAAESAESAKGCAEGRWLTLANGLTAIRLALVPVCALAIHHDLALGAFASFWLAVATDLADGRVARRQGQASARGAVLDHSTDALFVSTGLTALALGGEVPALLPVLVLAAFVQYALDSRVLAGRELRTSFIGRWNGIAYYVLLGTPIMRDALSLGWPSASLVVLLGWGLVVTTAVSMGDRAVAWALSRRAPDSPGAGR